MGPLPEVRGGKHSEIVASKLSGVLARDLMRGEAATADEDAPLSVILPLMDRSKSDDVLVTNGRVVSGVVSTSDLLKRRELPLTTKAKRIMVAPPVLRPSANAMELAETFISTRLRELPITDAQGRLEGVVTRRDLTAAVAGVREFGNVPIELIMTPEPRTVAPGDPMEKAEQLMRDLDIRTVPVTDDGGEVVGVVGLRDLAKFFWHLRAKETVGEVAGHSDPVDVTVESVMLPDPVTASPDVSIADAADRMLERRVSTLLVVDDGSLVGVVTEYDLLAHVAAFRGRDMVLVKVSGFEGPEDAYDALFQGVHSSMVKVAKIEKPNIIDIYIHTQRAQGDREAFHIQGRMTTEHRMYYSHATEWDVMRGLDALLSHLERQVKERKDEYLEWRRHAGS